MLFRSFSSFSSPSKKGSLSMWHSSSSLFSVLLELVRLDGGISSEYRSGSNSSDPVGNDPLIESGLPGGGSGPLSLESSMVVFWRESPLKAAFLWEAQREKRDGGFSSMGPWGSARNVEPWEEEQEIVVDSAIRSWL